MDITFLCYASGILATYAASECKQRNIQLPNLIKMFNKKKPVAWYDPTVYTLKNVMHSLAMKNQSRRIGESVINIDDVPFEQSVILKKEPSYFKFAIWLAGHPIRIVQLNGGKVSSVYLTETDIREIKTKLKV